MKFKYHLSKCVNFKKGYAFSFTLGAQFGLYDHYEIARLQNAIDINKDGQLDKFEIEKLFMPTDINQNQD